MSGKRAGTAKLLLLGQSGTGKSLVIKALDYFSIQVGARALTGALWGSPASNLSAQTLHALLGLHIRQRSSRQETAQFVKGTEILIIDEISVVGLNTLGLIEERLQEYFDTNAATGSAALHVILCGDFLQHDPVSDTPLWTTFNVGWHKRVVTGHQVWKSFRDVVILRKLYRALDSKLESLLNTLRKEGIFPVSAIC